MRWGRVYIVVVGREEDKVKGCLLTSADGAEARGGGEGGGGFWWHFGK